MAEDRSKDAVFMMTITNDFLAKFTTVETLDEFLFSMDKPTSRFVGILHRETEDRVEHLHFFYYCSYQQKKKKEIVDALYGLNIFNSASRSDLEAWMLGVVIKLDKLNYIRVAKLMIQRQNTTSVIPRSRISSKSVFFQGIFRTKEEFERKIVDGVVEHANDDCMAPFLQSDRNRTEQMARLNRQSENSSAERSEIFDRIRNIEKVKFQNYHSLMQLVKLLKAKSPTHFENLICEEERMTLYCGIPQYESILEEIFKNLEISELQTLNSQNYVDKLAYSYLRFFETSSRYNKLQPQMDWLEARKTPECVYSIWE